MPLALSLQFDDANGSSTGGTFNEYGFGLAARLTTPFYAGAGFSLYNTNARIPGRALGSVNETGIGTNYFIGERVLSLPGGINFGLQASYKQVPQFDGLNPSAFGVGLRVRL